MPHGACAEDPAHALWMRVSLGSSELALEDAEHCLALPGLRLPPQKAQLPPNRSHAGKGGAGSWLLVKIRSSRNAKACRAVSKDLSGVQNSPWLCCCGQCCCHQTHSCHWSRALERCLFKEPLVPYLPLGQLSAEESAVPDRRWAVIPAPPFL